VKHRTGLTCLLAAVGWACCGLCPGGPFPVDFQAAMRLFQSPGTRAEAEAAFLELAARDVRDPSGPDAALEMASWCAVQRRDLEAAEVRAGQVREAALRMLCRMRIREAERQWTRLVELAGAEPLETWPDRLVYAAAMCRGKAHAILGNAAAEKDFLLARANTYDATELARANLVLGDFYRDGARDEDRAMAAYEAVARAAVHGAVRYDGVMAYASLLTARGRGRDALAQLDALEVETIPHPDWQCRIYQAYGAVHAAQNSNADAAAAYRKAATVPNASRELVRAAEAKLAGVSR
jgi:hypothetical protein